jgi:hypothetical protein
MTCFDVAARSHASRHYSEVDSGLGRGVDSEQVRIVIL